jgi:hypothetical protein
MIAAVRAALVAVIVVSAASRCILLPPLESALAKADQHVYAGFCSTPEPRSWCHHV